MLRKSLKSAAKTAGCIPMHQGLLFHCWLRPNAILMQFGNNSKSVLPQRLCFSVEKSQKTLNFSNLEDNGFPLGPLQQLLQKYIAASILSEFREIPQISIFGHFL